MVGIPSETSIWRPRRSEEFSCRRQPTIDSSCTQNYELVPSATPHPPPSALDQRLAELLSKEGREGGEWRAVDSGGKPFD
jgi:hypothetical protein